ncbi:pyridoxamine 5'-phosphate oxidase family protein [Kitasatospora sp. NPDC004799]|uniref:pyridoxamine 5'-phosphate oxidase family protein n=1 Tax=Kitasatospora sp. NPDC004799 TaxID=3154460 RepID=UPI0033BF8E6E
MMTTASMQRRTAERVRDALDRLATERDVWLSTAHPEHGPHQVPLWFLWDGHAVWLCTSDGSATARNVRAEPRVRLSLPDTFDVLLVQGEAQGFPAQDVPADAARAFADKFGWDPRTEAKPYLYIRVLPTTVRAWRGVPELPGRVIMRDGTWLG